MQRVGRKFLITLVAVPVILVALILTARTIKQLIIRAETKIISEIGIESLEKVTLGGVEQWILIRSEDNSQPVLLWLHGGPGSPTLPLASQHDQELVKHFVVVHWDQRGAGKSFSTEIPASSMVVDQFAADAVELTQLLCERFEVPKIYLIGHSWGTQLGMVTVSRHPELYHAFIGVSQFVHSPAADEVIYPYLLEQAALRDHHKAFQELDELGPPPYTQIKERAVIECWTDRFGGTGRLFGSWDFILGMFISPDYTLGDFFKFIQGMSFSRRTIFENGEYVGTNLFEEDLSLELPIFIFQGRYDFSTPGEVASAYFDLLDCPEKSMVWFEESAHFLQWEEPEKFLEEMIQVLEETQ